MKRRSLASGVTATDTAPRQEKINYNNKTEFIMPRLGYRRNVYFPTLPHIQVVRPVVGRGPQ